MRRSIIVLSTFVLLVQCKGKPEQAPEQAAREAPASTVEKASGAGTAAQPPVEPAGDEAEPEAATPAGAGLLPLGRPDARLKVKPPAPVKYNKAKKAYKDKDRDGAKQLLDEALEADPYFTWALLLRARIHLRDGEKKECAALLERLVAYNYVHFAPQVSRLAWLKPLRADPAHWEPFEQKMEDYREAWAEALSGPGAFFVQSQFRKLEQTDAGGEPLDLRWARGAPVFWSKSLERYLVLGEHTDVAGFLLDRAGDMLVLARYQPHEEQAPGLLGKVLVTRIDLTEVKAEPRSTEIASGVQMVRLALDDEGNVLFVDETWEEPAADEIEEEEEEETSDEEEEDEEEEDEEEEDEEDDDDVPEGPTVPRLDWETGKKDEGTLDTDEGWLLVLTLGATEGPDPVSVPGAPDDSPKAKRGGACFWMDEQSALCFEPTKRGGTWHHLDLHASGSEPLRLTGEPIPLVQY